MCVRPQLKDSRLKRRVRSGISPSEEDLRGLEGRNDLLEARRLRFGGFLGAATQGALASLAISTGGALKERETCEDTMRKWMNVCRVGNIVKAS